MGARRGRRTSRERGARGTCCRGSAAPLMRGAATQGDGAEGLWHGSAWAAPGAELTVPLQRRGTVPQLQLFKDGHREPGHQGRGHLPLRAGERASHFTETL